MTSKKTDDALEQAIPDKYQLQCVGCKTALDPRGENTILELDPTAVSGNMIIGHMCDECATKLRKRIEKANQDGPGV